ncbi:ABC transporter substrate-binding protein [Vulcanisaeta thermophila]|uniref:ABC transporter substrate-binding protein n=1 Tax=Vulcanisaeta thermophila TaxID=867917 RepID=UPI000852D1A2|nr:ABC transporter substrate-binding protein [Vulcanisaeta thermophila]
MSYSLEKSGISRTYLIAIIVIIVVVAVVIAAYYTVMIKPSKPSVTISCPLPSNTSVLISIENEPPNSVDPATGFYAGEDEIMTNVYQGLIAFDITSTNVTTFVPIIAESWYVAPNYTTYIFYIRHGVYFANGDPVNATTFWFSIYRVIIMNQVDASFFTNILYNGTEASITGYAIPWGVCHAITYATGNNAFITNKTLCAYALANILSNFDVHNTTIQKIMEYPNQAIVVIDPYTIEFKLLQPYMFLLQILAEYPASAVDPVFVDQHGGVVPNQQNTYMNTHTMGTGPYQVTQWVPGEMVVLQANPNYWAAKLPSSESNIMLTPPKIKTIIIEYTSSANQIISMLDSGKAQLMGPLAIPALSPMYLSSLEQNPCLKVVVEPPSAPTWLFLMITLDTQKYPLNITAVRVALAHAINYTEIIDTVAPGVGIPYVGPISPGMPFYNPDNLPPYNYDPNLSIEILRELGFKLTLPNGTIINPNGQPLTLTLTYVSDDPAQVKIAQEVQIMLSQIGVQLTLNPVTTQQEENLISQPCTAPTYPQMLIWYWFPSWPDPIYQDLVVQTNVKYSGIAGNVACFNNTEVNEITNVLPFMTNTTLVTKYVSTVYNITYQQVPDIWLYAIRQYWVQSCYVSGVYWNPGVLGYYFPLMYYNFTACKP